VLVRAGAGFEADPDLDEVSLAFSAATNVTILDERPSERAGLPDNGVLPTRRVAFRDNKLYLSKPEAVGQFERQTTLGIMALLRAYPEADAYWLGWDAAVPLLLRRGRRLVLSQVETRPGEFWDSKRAPTRALVDLPYVVEPLGPWPYIPIEAPEPIGQR
jgi:hypothetical protein